MLYYIQNSLIGLCIIIIIFVNFFRKTGRMQYSEKIYIIALIVNGLLLSLELFLNITTGNNSGIARLILPIIVAVFYILNPIPEAFWILYLDSIVNKDKKPTKILLLSVGIPILLNTIFSLISLFKNFTFYIDANNIYNRGAYYILMPIICYSYLIIYMFMVLSKRKFILRSEFYSLFLSVMPPIIAGILQSVFYGISVVWVSVSFSLLIIYIRIQSVRVNTDYLTGLANKRKLDMYIDSLDYNGQKKLSIGGILIDIDNFKNINDVYGHDIGDKILEEVGEILRRSLSRKSLIARTGGDEFVAIIENCEKTTLDNLINNINEQVDNFNIIGDYKFPLSFSIGYDIYNPIRDSQVKDFIKYLDVKMYESKKKKKRK